MQEKMDVFKRNYRIIMDFMRLATGTKHKETGLGLKQISSFNIFIFKQT